MSGRCVSIDRSRQAGAARRPSALSVGFWETPLAILSRDLPSFEKPAGR
jgi:hypothetical protein